MGTGSAGVTSAAIVGAAGFLGSHAVRGFEARGVRVVPLVRVLGDRSPAGAHALADTVAAPELLTGVEAMVHVAAASSRPGGDAAGERTGHLELLERAMSLAAKAGIARFVLVSSVAVYGFPRRLPITEDHPYAPRTAYAATRVEAEIRARRIARDLGLELCIARLAAVYGPGDRHGPVAAMASMIRAGTYRVVGPGDNVLHHLHVDDAVEGLWLAATRPAGAGDHVILAGPETTTLAELSALVASAVGRPLPRRHVPSTLARAVATLVDMAADRGVFAAPPLVHARLDGLTLPTWFDIARARRHLGFAPRVSYEEGIQRTLRGEWPALAQAGTGS